MADVRPGLQHVKQRQRRQDVLLHKRPQQRREALRVADLILHVVIAITNREVGCGIGAHDCGAVFEMILDAAERKVILSLIKTIDYPTTLCNALYRIRGQGANGIAKPIYYFLQSSKHFITEARDSEFFPYLLDGIHLRRIRWNVKQLYVFRDMKLVRLVPCCTITTQQDQIIRVLLGQFLKKYVHTSRIAIRHNKKTGASRYWFNSSVCIPIFANVMARYRWTNALFTPAVFGLIDSSESCFILEHKSYFLMWMARLVYIIL